MQPTRKALRHQPPTRSQIAGLSHQPIFIGGVHRSGTTLLSLILDSHPAVICGPELDFLEPVDLGPHIVDCIQLLQARDLRVEGKGVETRDPVFQLGVQFVKQCWRFGVGPTDLLDIVVTTMADTRGDLRLFEDRCVLIDRLGEARRVQEKKARWGLKIQMNIVLADRLARIWPDLKVVHIVRDGRDVASSQLLGNRGWGFRSIEEAALGWVEVLRGVRRGCRGLELFELRYEDLVTDPEPVLRRLLQFLGISWNDSVCRHHAYAHSLQRHPFDHPSAEEAARPIHRGAIGKHRLSLPAEDVERFDQIAGYWLRRFGYTTAGHA
jgi:hypothetical protein